MSDSPSLSSKRVAEEIRALKEEIRRLRAQLSHTVDRMASRRATPPLRSTGREPRKRTSGIFARGAQGQERSEE